MQPSHRGRGIGFQLWQHAIGHAGRRTIGLDGVPEQQDNYASSGFMLAGGTTRFSGRVSAMSFDDIHPACRDDSPGFIAREAEVTGTLKRAYLSAWFTNTENRQTIHSEQGFCTVRRCRDGAKVGPLIAADISSAHRLIQHAATLFGTDIVIDVPNASAGLQEVCQSLGFAPSFQTARMYLGSPPGQKAALFAVTSLELG